MRLDYLVVKMVWFKVGEKVTVPYYKNQIQISHVNEHFATGASTHPSGRNRPITFIENVHSKYIYVVSGMVTKGVLPPRR